MKKNHTAILIFARTAREEASHKKLGQSVALFEELNRQTIQVAKETGLPYFLCTEKDQRGSTFGERLANAVSSIYAQGYDQVISIGNDTPHLEAAHILTAQKQLESHSLILGPSTDGGFYLMGLRKTHFKKDIFQRLPWQSRTLNQAISRTLSRKRTTIYRLETLTDIDSLRDLKTILRKQKRLPYRIHLLIKDVLGKKSILFYYTIQPNFESHRAIYFNKGSPRMIC